MKKSLITAAAVILMVLAVWWAVSYRGSEIEPGPGIPDNSLKQPGASVVPEPGDTKGDEAPTQPPADKAQDHGVYPGDRAYVFQLPDLEGNTVKLSDYSDRVVLLCFWQTTSSWCLEALPLLDGLYKAYKDGDGAVLAINVGEEADSVRGIIDDGGYSFPVLLDEEAGAAKKYMVSYLPTSYVINRRGEISAMHIGLMEYDDMEEYVEAAFRE